MRERGRCLRREASDAQLHDGRVGIGEGASTRRRVRHRAGPGGLSLAGRAHGPSSLRRQSLLAVAASRSCVGTPERSGSRDRRIARRQHLGRPRRRRRRRSHSTRADRPVLDRRWRAARRDRDDPGSAGRDLGGDSSRAVQVRQQPLDAGSERARATRRRGLQPVRGSRRAAVGRAPRPASTDGRRMSSSSWTPASRTCRA